MSPSSNRKVFIDDSILKLLNVLFKYSDKHNEKINTTSNIQRYIINRGVKILL